MNKVSLYILIGLVVAGAGITVAQIWGVGIDWETYLKLMGTLAIVFLVVGLVVVIKADLGRSKKLKDENYLD